MKLNIMGTEYDVAIKKFDDDPIFAENSFDGYCDGYAKTIIVCDMHTYPGWNKENEATVKAAQKATLRHEIVHAFLYESGLADSSHRYERGWAKNEEMIDWLAFQTPKMYRVFREAKCL